LILEVRELACFGHGSLFHEERCVEGGVAFGGKETEAVLGKGEVQETTGALQEVTFMSSNFDTSLRIIPINSFKDLVMMIVARGLGINLKIWDISPLNCD
jgi:hypothetical protein